MRKMKVTILALSVLLHACVQDTPPTRGDLAGTVASEACSRTVRCDGVVSDTCVDSTTQWLCVYLDCDAPASASDLDLADECLAWLGGSCTLSTRPSACDVPSWSFDDPIGF